MVGQAVLFGAAAAIFGLKFGPYPVLAALQAFVVEINTQVSGQLQ